MAENLSDPLYKRENNGKTRYQKGFKMNEFKNIKTCFRPLTPEAYTKILAWALALILYIPYLIILLVMVARKSFLRMVWIIAGKIREKL